MQFKEYFIICTLPPFLQRREGNTSLLPSFLPAFHFVLYFMKRSWFNHGQWGNAKAHLSNRGGVYSYGYVVYCTYGAKQSGSLIGNMLVRFI